MQQTHCDILIIGSGIAGLSFALHSASFLPDGNIVLITKERLRNSNTELAQGGIAVVTDLVSDTNKKHIEDTLKAGDGKCNEQIVDLVVNKAAQGLNQLEKWGVTFDKTTDGTFHLSNEGGHTAHRVVHHKDRTGREISSKLIHAVQKTKNIKVLEQHIALDLLIDNTNQGTSCEGLQVLNSDNSEVTTIRAKQTVLATGGVGALFKKTSNSLVATGDGIAIALRANVKVSGMEYIQFHPTVMYNQVDQERVLITEAIRGFGAILKNSKGEAFMKRYDPREDLASRDIVSRAIYKELQLTSSSYVYLDCRHLDQTELAYRFPELVKSCSSNGIDVKKDLIPVSPAAHYLCGGIDVNEYAQTSINGLFAVGECSNTGLHGANRLASNSLLEAIVFSEMAANRCVNLTKKQTKKTSPLEEKLPTSKSPNLEQLVTSKNKIQRLIQNSAGIVRTDDELEIAFKQLIKIKNELEILNALHVPTKLLVEVRNMCWAALSIIEASLDQKDNHGCFYKLKSLEN
jgi:L-aspartate oxidase